MGYYEDYLKKKNSVLASKEIAGTATNDPVFQAYLEKKKSILGETPTKPSEVAKQEIQQKEEAVTTTTKPSFFDQIKSTVSKVISSISPKKKIEEQLAKVETPKIDTSKIKEIKPMGIISSAPVADQSAQLVSPIISKNIFDETLGRVNKAVESIMPGGYEDAVTRVKAVPVKDWFFPTASGPAPEAFRQYIDTTFKGGVETAKAFYKLTPAYKLEKSLKGEKISVKEDLLSVAQAGLGTLNTLYRTSVIAPILGATFGGVKAARKKDTDIISGAFGGVNEQPGLGEAVTDNPIAQTIIDVGFMATMVAKPYVGRKLDTIKLKSSEITKVSNILGVRPDAPLSEISAAYKKKIVNYKEVFAGRGTLEQIAEVKKLNDSYEILKRAGVWQRKLAGLFGKVNLSDIKTVVKPKSLTEKAGITPVREPITMTPEAAIDTVKSSDLNNTPAGNKIIEQAAVAKGKGVMLEIDTTGESGIKVVTPGLNSIGIKIGLGPKPTTSPEPLGLTKPTREVVTEVQKQVPVAETKVAPLATTVKAVPDTLKPLQELAGKFKTVDDFINKFIELKDKQKSPDLTVADKKFISIATDSKLTEEFVKWNDNKPFTINTIKSFYEKYVSVKPITTPKTFYRGGPESAMPKNMTAKQIVEYEQKELGNADIKVEPGIDIEKVPTKNLVWLTETRVAAGEYGKVSTIQLKDYRIIARDGQGGVLVEKLTPEIKTIPQSRKRKVRAKKKKPPTEMQVARAEVAKQQRQIFEDNDLKTIAKAKRLMNLKRFAEGDVETLAKVMPTQISDLLETVRRIENNLELSASEAIDIAMSVPTARETYPRYYPEADVGGYADVKSRMKELEGIKAVEFPELLRMYRTLTNKVPVLKALRSYLGVHRAGGITLNREIFKNPTIAVKVFAHEFGHLTDYFPEKTMSRGNILGRIASMRRYLKHMLPESPTAEAGILTPQDRSRLRSEAKQSLSKPQLEEVEVIIGEKKATPSEIMAIWNDTMAGETMPGLMEYIKLLGEKEKVEIVKGAIKGVLPEWANFSIITKEKKLIEVMKNAPADIKKKYQELVREEIKSRGLFAIEEITTELKALTQLWKPFNPGLDPGYTKYRFSGKELYADAISVLFNDPALLKEKAPEFYRGFFNWMDNKPEIRDNFFDLQNLLNAGDEQIFQERYKALEKSYKTGEEGWLAQEIEKKNNKINVIGMLNTLFNDKNYAINKKVIEAIKSGKNIESEFNPIYDLAGLNYMEGAIKEFVHDNFQPVVTKANEVINGWSDLGKILQLERAMFERGELANPGGYDPKTAKWTLDEMEKHTNPEDWQKLQEAKEMFRKGMQALVNQAEKEGFYRPEMLEQMKANKSYATFQVLDYIDQKITSAVHQQKGTLKDIANPATTSLMKMVTTLRAMRYNKSKKVNLKFLKDLGELEDAKMIWNGKTKVPIESRNKDLGLVKVIIVGKIRAFYVDKEVSTILNHIDEPNLRKLGTITKVLTQTRIYRPLFTSLNLGFQLFNFQKDFQRTWRNMPDKTVGQSLLSYPKLVNSYIKSVPAAWAKAVGSENDIVREMETNEIFGLNRNDLYGTPDPGEEEVTRVLRRIGVVPGKEGRSALKTVLKPVIKLFDGIEVVGNFIEALPKIAGYRILKGEIGEKELAHYVRNYIGSPDFLTNGTATPITNNVFLFSNAAKEGIKGDINMATRPKTRGAWWFKSILGLMPKLMQIAGTMGLLGVLYKKQLDSVSEYDKANYTIVPIGTDENGKTIYVRIPADETGRFQGAMLWKLANALKGGDKQTLLDNLSDIFSLWSGQLPNLTPSITGAQALSTYLSGKNPWDSFRNRNVLTDNEYKAGFKYSWPKMLQWLLNNQGASIVIPAYRADGNEGAMEKMLNLPVLSNLLGRFVRVSNYGQTEIDQKIKAEIEQKNAQKTMRRNEAIDGAVKNNRAPNLTDIENVLGHKLDTNNKDDVQEVANLMKKYEVQKLEGKNVFLDSLIYANTNEAKAEMLARYQKEMTGEDFYNLLTTAASNKIITNDVMNKYLEKTKEVKEEKKGLLNFKIVKEAYAAEGIEGTQNKTVWNLDMRTGWQKFLDNVGQFMSGKTVSAEEEFKKGEDRKKYEAEQKVRNEESMKYLRSNYPEWYKQNINAKTEKRLTGKELGEFKQPARKEQVLTPTPENEQADTYIGLSQKKPEGEIGKQVINTSKKHSMRPELISAMLWQESGYKTDARNGTKETGIDRGIAQINSKAHPDVTDGQADDPEFAINWLGKEFASNLKHFDGDINRAIAAHNVGRGGANNKGDTPSGLGPRGQKYVDNVSRNLTKELRLKLGIKTTYDKL